MRRRRFVLAEARDLDTLDCLVFVCDAATLANYVAKVARHDMGVPIDRVAVRTLAVHRDRHEAVARKACEVDSLTLLSRRPTADGRSWRLLNRSHGAGNPVGTRRRKKAAVTP